MKRLRSNRPVTLLFLSRTLSIALVLVNPNLTVMAKEPPKIVKTEQKMAKAQPNTVLKTMVVTEKSDQKLAAASAEVNLSPGGAGQSRLNFNH